MPLAAETAMSALTTTITGTGLTEFPGAGTTLSTRVFHLTSEDFVGSVTVKARARGTTRTFVPISYMRRYLNGAVSDDTSNAAAITGTSIIQVNGAGLDVALDCTAYTSGTLAVDTDDLVG
jgi:hypothetical protein